MPRQGIGNIRGSSLGNAGAFHDPNFANLLVHDNPMVKDQVDTERAIEHKKFMNGKAI